MKNRFVKSAAAIFLTLVFAVGGLAQETCELASKTAPLLLNLQIGSAPEQAQAVFGKDLKIKIKKNGERTFFQNFIKKPAPGSLKAVRALYLRFFDRKLYQIEIFYEPRTDLPKLESIAETLSAQLRIPTSNWEIKNKQVKMICGENSLVADNILNPRVELTNETIRAEIEKLRENKSK